MRKKGNFKGTSCFFRLSKNEFSVGKSLNREIQSLCMPSYRSETFAQKLNWGCSCNVKRIKDNKQNKRAHCIGVGRLNRRTNSLLSNHNK